jgi:hypothetical protein
MDLFISHASEDKAAIARPLADALIERGLRVWYDEYTLTLGDTLGREIDRGLASCEFGVVILSPNFFAKEWPRQELDALVAREVNERTKRILPVWHNIDHLGITQHSPLLAAKLGIPTTRGITAVAIEIQRALSVPSRTSVSGAQGSRHTSSVELPLAVRLKVEAPSLGCGSAPGQPLRFHTKATLVNRGSRALVLTFRLKWYLEPSDERRWVAIPEARPESERLKIETDDFAIHELVFFFHSPENYGGEDYLLRRPRWLEVTDHISDQRVEISLPTPG